MYYLPLQCLLYIEEQIKQHYMCTENDSPYWSLLVGIANKAEGTTNSSMLELQYGQMTETQLSFPVFVVVFC